MKRYISAICLIIGGFFFTMSIGAGFRDFLYLKTGVDVNSAKFGGYAFICFVSALLILLGMKLREWENSSAILTIYAMVIAITNVMTVYPSYPEFWLSDSTYPLRLGALIIGFIVLVAGSILFAIWSEGFRWFWIKGTGTIASFLLIGIFTNQHPFIDSHPSSSINWLLSFGLAISPIGAAAGYLLFWILKSLLGLLLDKAFGIDLQKSSNSDTEESKMASYVREIKRGRIEDIILPLADSEIDKLKKKFGDDFGELRNNGKIISKGIIQTEIGFITEDGKIIRKGGIFDKGPFRKIIGHVDKDGRIKD